MRRSLSTLLAVTMVSMVLSGCFTDDKDGGSSDDGLDDGLDGNLTDDNQTDDPWDGARIPPEPVIKIGLEANNENVTGPPFLVDSNAHVNVTFDASESVAYQGGIQALAWEIESAAGWTGKSQNTTFTADFGQMDRYKFGVYKVTLRVLDDAAVRGETVAYFVIDYRFTTTGPGFFGPGSGTDRDEVGESTRDNTLERGTYFWEPVNIVQNATAINATLTFTPRQGGKMNLFLFDPNVTQAQSNDDDTELVEAGVESSPVALSHSDGGETLPVGTYHLRGELDGFGIEDYQLEVIVTFTAPPLPEPDLSLGGDDEDDEEDEDNEEE